MATTFIAKMLLGREKFTVEYVIINGLVEENLNCALRRYMVRLGDKKEN